MHRKRSPRQQNKGKRLAERVKVHTTLEVSGKGVKMRCVCLLENKEGREKSRHHGHKIENTYINKVVCRAAVIF